MVDILSTATADSNDGTQHLKSDTVPKNTTHYALESSLSYRGNPRPAEYSCPITTACAQEKPSVKATSCDEENTYQPLLPIRLVFSYISHCFTFRMYNLMKHVHHLQSRQSQRTFEA